MADYKLRHLLARVNKNRQKRLIELLQLPSMSAVIVMKMGKWKSRMNV